MKKIRISKTKKNKELTYYLADKEGNCVQIEHANTTRNVNKKTKIIN